MSSQCKAAVEVFYAVPLEKKTVKEINEIFQ